MDFEAGAVVGTTTRHAKLKEDLKGALLGHPDISIPEDQIDRIEPDTIYLKLDKRAIGRLTPIALRRQTVNSQTKEMDRYDLDDKATRR